MKLSLWIIQDWLSKYETLATISKGEQSIEGIRFFSNDTIQDNRFVYLCSNHDVFLDSDSNEILLMHGNDIISIDHDDFGAVHNEVSEIFEFYNKWELSLKQAANSDTPEQDIVDACADVFGPMFILDLEQSLIAHSSHYAAGEINHIWDDFVLYGNVSLATFRDLRNSSVARLSLAKHDCLEFNEPIAKPYSKGIMISYCDSEGNLLGQLVIASKTPISKRDLQLAKHIKQALDEIKHQSIGSNAGDHSEALLKSIAESKPADDYDIRKLLCLQEWNTCDNYCFAVMSTMVRTHSLLESYKSTLQTQVSSGVFACSSERIVSLIRVKDSSIPFSLFEEITANTGLYIGASRVFSDIFDTPLYVQQAQNALEYGGRTNKPISQFHECGLYSLLTQNNTDAKIVSLHPILKELEAYDHHNSTELSDTLRVFLQNERSFLTTSKVMFVHRNTIAYRIEKIQDLFHIDLNDPYEREYILTSFRVAEYL